MVIFVDFIKISSNLLANEHDWPMKKARKNETMVFDECAPCMKISKSIHDFKILTIAIQIKYSRTASSSPALLRFTFCLVFIFLCSRLRPRSYCLLRLRPRLYLCLCPRILLNGQADVSTMNGNARGACNDQSTRLGYGERICESLLFRLKQRRLSIFSRCFSGWYEAPWMAHYDSPICQSISTLRAHSPRRIGTIWDGENTFAYFRFHYRICWRWWRYNYTKKSFFGREGLWYGWKGMLKHILVPSPSRTII